MKKYKNLRVRMLMHDYNISSLAEAVGYSRVEISSVLNGKHKFTNKLKDKISEVLDIEPKDYYLFFDDNFTNSKE